MDWNKLLYDENEKPLDRFVEGYSRTSIFRTMAFIGDSLSSGEFESRNAEGKPGYHDMFEYSWGQFIARKNSIHAYSFSRGGMTAEEYLNSFAESKGFWDKEKACQAYVIALGVNDIYNRGFELGSVDDIDPNDYRNNKHTFVGLYASIVARYKEISPDAKFFFVTFPKESSRKNTEVTLAANKAFYDLAEYFENAYVLDLYTYGPVYDERFLDRFFLYGHLNPDGYLFTAEMVDSYIDYIIRHNPDDFRRVGFINKGLH